MKMNENLIRQARLAHVQKIVVGAVILRNQEFLCLKRASSEFMAGLVELPSGNVEENETLYQALKREIYEETGIRITKKDCIDYLGCFDYLSGSGKKARQYNFLVKTLTSRVTIDCNEHAGCEWLPLNKIVIENKGFSKETKMIICKAICEPGQDTSNVKFPADDVAIIGRGSAKRTCTTAPVR